MLSRTWALRDIEDVEKLCTARARRWCETSGTYLTELEQEDLVAFLVTAVWKMSETFDPARSPSLRAVVLAQLGNRCVDWFRQHRGRTRWQFGDRTYERERPQPVSLDAPATGGDGRPLVETLVDGQSDSSPGRDPSPFGGVLDGRDRDAPWDQALVRAAARRVAGERAVRDRRDAA